MSIIFDGPGGDRRRCLKQTGPWNYELKLRYEVMVVPVQRTMSSISLMKMIIYWKEEKRSCRKCSKCDQWSMGQSRNKCGGI